MASVQAKVDEGCTSSTDEAVRWEDLPGELLSKIASGREALKAMRLVCSTWQTGFDNSVTGLRYSVTTNSDGSPLYEIGRPRPRDSEICIPHIASRFPGAVRLQLGLNQLSKANLGALLGSRIQAVNFSASGHVSSKALSVLSGLSLTDLNLQHTSVKDIGIAALEGLPLTRLCLEGCEKIVGGGFFFLQGMPLKWLDLGNCRDITSAGLATLRGFPLTWLNLGGCSKSTLAGIACLRGLPLTHLNLSNCPEITADTVVELRDMPLTSLGLGGCFGRDEGCIEALRGMSIRRLNLGFNKMTKVGLVGLRGLPFLTDLSLQESCTGFTPEGLEALRALPLTRLNLDMRLDIKNFGSVWSHIVVYAGGFWELHGLQLKDLSLAGHKGVKDEGLRAFWNMPLTKLDLSDCCLITGETLEAMRNLPLKVLRLDNCERIDDDSLMYIRNMPLTYLSILDVERITDLSVPMLRGLATLKSLEIRGTSISVEAADILTAI